MTETLDFEDIQGLLAHGYGNLKAACFVLLQIGDPTSVKAWLRSTADAVTTAHAKPKDYSLNIAFTYSGLSKLGLSSDLLAMFSTEFVYGMTTPHRRRILGDTAENAPELWTWGGPRNMSVDALLLMYARDQPGLSDFYGSYSEAFAASGLEEVRKLETGPLTPREHFGFHDGIAQPVIEGGARPGTPANTIRAGEFILGYPNEYGLYTERPILKATDDGHGLLPSDPSGLGGADLGRNGSYLVFRQLSQDVRRFWGFIDGATRNDDGTSNPTLRAKLAAKLVGRWPSGAPLVVSPDEDDVSLADFDDFGYHRTDPHGYKCPIGAHIRRSHPRDMLDPRPGSRKSVDVDKRHRILRRGRTYGTQITPEEALSPGVTDEAEEERGLHFICLNANIARQFEFVQHTWSNNPKFGGLYSDVDPISGGYSAHTGTFTIQSRPLRQQIASLPLFVTVRGGGYFYLPGVRAIRYLSSLEG